MRRVAKIVLMLLGLSLKAIRRRDHCYMHSVSREMGLFQPEGFKRTI